ncbi:hypothetical protein Y1Q_0005612 [Alligator mississippiensis]|uniref:Uncharacterized protein n=1 Tax=Alligator mississippiensis TaxID=8496 RepID=A0A151MF90_ALLMI|nr:hypothetical protein Y1Q_0005612 [Alligator mississippiensis]
MSFESKTTPRIITTLQGTESPRVDMSPSLPSTSLKPERKVVVCRGGETLQKNHDPNRWTFAQRDIQPSQENQTLKAWWASKSEGDEVNVE